MKKLLGILSCMGALIFCALPAKAYVLRQSSANLVAQTTTGGTKGASFAIELRDATNIASHVNRKAAITWPGTIDPNTGVTWVLSNTAIKLVHNVTDARGGIQIFTENKLGVGNQADPRFVDPSPGSASGTLEQRIAYYNGDSNPAGLMDATGGISNYTLPMAWTIKSTPRNINQDNATTGVLPSDPDTGPTSGNAYKYQWLHLQDRGFPGYDWNGDGDALDLNADADSLEEDFPGFVNGQDFSDLVIGSQIHVGQGPSDLAFDADKDSYVYFEANFGRAAAATPYKTARITVEAYTE